MLRGAIERIDELHIQGWVYSPVVSVRGLKLLAFNGARCAGAGIVDIFRDDLASAGLGDGYCGFRFAYTLKDAESPRHLTIRFENSDFELRQADTAVIALEGPMPAAPAMPAAAEPDEAPVSAAPVSAAPVSVAVATAPARRAEKMLEQRTAPPRLPSIKR